MKRNLSLVWSMVRDIFSEYSEGIRMTIGIILSLIIGIFLGITLLVPQPLSEQQFQRLETIAQQVANDEEVRDTSGVTITEQRDLGTITVSMEEGKVTARFWHNELILERSDERVAYWVFAIFMGLVLAFLTFWTLFLILYGIEKMVEAVGDSWREAKRAQDNKKE